MIADDQERRLAFVKPLTWLRSLVWTLEEFKEFLLLLEMGLDLYIFTSSFRFGTAHGTLPTKDVAYFSGGSRYPRPSLPIHLSCEIARTD